MNDIKPELINFRTDQHKTAKTKTGIFSSCAAQWLRHLLLIKYLMESHFLRIAKGLDSFFTEEILVVAD